MKNNVTKGWRTSEFWMTLGAVACGLLYASGIIAPDDGTSLERVISLVAAMLASAGYAYNRSSVKVGANK